MDYRVPSGGGGERVLSFSSFMSSLNSCSDVGVTGDRGLTRGLGGGSALIRLALIWQWHGGGKGFGEFERYAAVGKICQRWYMYCALRSFEYHDWTGAWGSGLGPNIAQYHRACSVSICEPGSAT